MPLTETFPVEDKEHYRRIMSLLFRKWRRDDGYTPRTNTMLTPSWQEALILKSLFISILGLSDLEAESLIVAYGEERGHVDFSRTDEALAAAMDKIRQRQSLEILVPYVDCYMGLGSREQAMEKFLNFVSENTDYGYPGWEK
jgi:hypothetical protein